VRALRDELLSKVRKQVTDEQFAALSKALLVGDADYRAEQVRETTYAWKGVAEPEHFVVLGGPSGGGKTTLSELLAAAFANPTGKPVEVLGREVTPVPAGKYVLCIQEENGRRSFSKGLEVACQLLGLPVAATRDRMISSVRGNVRFSREGYSQCASGLVEVIKAGLVGATFIDTWATVMGGDANSEEDQAQAAKFMRWIVECTGGLLFVVMHTRKTGAEAIEDLSGSGQRGAGADVIVLVTAERDHSGEVLSSTAKFVKLRDFDGDEWPEPVTYSISKTAPGGPRLAIGSSAREEDQPAHERLFQLLEREGWQTKQQMKTKVKMSGKRLEQALTVLFADRRIHKRETGRHHRGEAISEFALRPSQVETSLFTPMRRRRRAS
jgi:energy-coupling factor transporter ATP-binding protein EcfA2